jgi:hypothetical protein
VEIGELPYLIIVSKNLPNLSHHPLEEGSLGLRTGKGEGKEREGLR